MSRKHGEGGQTRTVRCSTHTSRIFCSFIDGTASTAPASETLAARRKIFEWEGYNIKYEVAPQWELDYNTVASKYRGAKRKTQNT